MSSYNVSEKYPAIRAEYLGTCNGVYMFRFGKEGTIIPVQLSDCQLAIATLILGKMYALEWNKRWRCIHSG